MEKPLWLAAWLLVIELVTILLLIPGDWTDRAIEREAKLVEQSLGGEASGWIDAKASAWFRSSIIDSGFYAGMYHTLIPSEAEKKKSKGMEQMGDDWFKWAEGRIDAVVNVIYQFYARLALLVAWAPYMLLLLVPAAFDGLMTWKIKRTNFAYASPVIHRYSIRGTGFILVGLFIAFFAPIALDPVIIPMAMMVCCVLVGLAIGNLQKRV